MAQEHFEYGQMFWREDNDRITVLYNAGTWALYRDIWNEGDPEYSCPEIAPSQCPPTPRRGFGKIWCTYPAVRQRLGWATNYERGFHGTVQDFEQGPSSAPIPGRHMSCWEMEHGSARERMNISDSTAKTHRRGAESGRGVPQDARTLLEAV